MDLGAENELVFKDLARAWAQEPKVQSEDQILENLLAGYWLGEFEELLIDRPEHWPDRRVTYSTLIGCEGLPAEGLPEIDGGSPNWERLSKVKFQNYSAPGQAVLNAVDLPKDMIRIWCLDKGYSLPNFWFATDAASKPVGRPSINNRLLGQIELRAANNILESTLAAEARTLHDWATLNLGHEAQIPQPKSIENIVRADYRRLRTAENTQPH